MAGLLQQGMQGAQRPPQGQQPPPRGKPQGQRPPQGQQPPGRAQAPQQQRPPQEGQPEGQVDAPPEQAKEQMNALLEAGLGYLYGDGMDPAVKAMQNAQDPQTGMAKVIGSILLTAFNTLQSQGSAPAPNVMMATGMNLSKAVGEMAIEAGLLPEDQPDVIEGAFMDGVARFGKLVDSQALGPAQKQRYAEMIRGMRQMKGGGQAPQGQQAGQRPAPPPDQPPAGGRPPQPRGGM